MVDDLAKIEFFFVLELYYVGYPPSSIVGLLPDDIFKITRTQAVCVSPSS